jgi:hypothetical protein
MTDQPIALVDHDPVTRRALDEQGVPPHRTTEIARALVEGGKQTGSRLFYRTVDNTLSAAAKRKNSLLEKVEDGWALIEWRRPA